MKRIAIAVIGLALVGCGGDSDEGNGKDKGGGSSGAGADSPDAVFAKAMAALNDSDKKAFASCLTPESQTEIATSLIIGAAMKTAMKEDGKAEFEAILKKHGLEKPPAEGEAEPAVKKALEGVKDKPQLVADLGDWMEKFGGEGSNTKSDATLKNVKIDGDKATGTVVTKRSDGTDKTEPTEFHRIDGKWYIHLTH
ncbi:MAG: hypothetical protein HY720_03950 [Planctomycetes bacterium]|nr:hypothetical protein [Planctomycetota bacterium]